MNRFIIKDLSNTVLSMLLKGVASIPMAVGVSVFLYICLVIYTKKKNLSVGRAKKTAIIALGFYLSALIHMAILSRPIGSISQIDLIPFNTPGGTRYIILYAVANAVIFVPLGILLPVVFSKMRNMGRSVFTGFILSFIIETCQLVLCCGVVQTEDIIMNTLGTAIGYLIYRVIVKMQRKFGGDGRGQKR